jgi:hypothetical protein
MESGESKKGEWKLPKDPKIEDFQRLMCEQSSFYRSRYQHTTISDLELLIRLVGFESCAREVIVSAIYEPERDWLGVYKQAIRIARNPCSRALQMLHQRGLQDSQLRFIVWIRLNLIEIYDEFRKRLDRQRVGRAFYRTFLNRPEALEELRTALHVERIKSYRPSKECDEDLRADGVEAAVRKLEDLRLKIRREMSFPECVQLPKIPVLPSDSRTDGGWEWEKLRAKELQDTIVAFLPLLSGEAEGILTKVHDALKEHFRKFEAAKRDGEEIPICDEKGRLIDEVEIVSVPGVEEQVLSKMAVISLGQIAAERWGKKGSDFIRALLDDKTIKEASRIAGVSRQTGNKYFRELYRIVLDED